RCSRPTGAGLLPCWPMWRRCTVPPASAASRRRCWSSWRRPAPVLRRGMRGGIGERNLRNDVSRETSSANGWDGSPFYAKMFHVKHRAAGPKTSILQNNPMDQKIALVFQRHDLAHFRGVRDRRKALKSAIRGLRGGGEASSGIDGQEVL